LFARQPPEPPVMDARLAEMVPPQPPPSTETEDSRVFWKRLELAVRDLGVLLLDRSVEEGEDVVLAVMKYAHEHIRFLRFSGNTPIALVKAPLSGENNVMGINKILVAMFGQLGAMRTCYERTPASAAATPPEPPASPSDDVTTQIVAAKGTKYACDNGLMHAALVMERAITTTFQSDGSVLRYRDDFLNRLPMLYAVVDEDDEDRGEEEDAIGAVLKALSYDMDVVEAKDTMIGNIARMALFCYVTGAPCGKLKDRPAVGL